MFASVSRGLAAPLGHGDIDTSTSKTAQIKPLRYVQNDCRQE